jgi:hypothetical protein
MKILLPRSFTRARSECRVIIYKPDVTRLYHHHFFVNNKSVMPDENRGK